jgi:hypothetical protein
MMALFADVMTTDEAVDCLTGPTTSQVAAE